MSVFHLGRSETEILGLPRSNEPASKATHRTGISSPIFSVEHLLEQKRKTCDGAFRLREKRRIDFELVKCCLKREERGQSTSIKRIAQLLRRSGYNKNQLECTRPKMGFPGSTSGEEPTCQCRRCKSHRFHPWLGKIPWRGSWQPIPVFLPGESHGQRSLVGCRS